MDARASARMLHESLADVPKVLARHSWSDELDPMAILGGCVVQICSPCASLRISGCACVSLIVASLMVLLSNRSVQCAVPNELVLPVVVLHL
jgi:hypothetical protein